MIISTMAEQHQRDGDIQPASSPPEHEGVHWTDSLPRLSDEELVAGVHFVVRNVAAEELRLRISRNLVTLDDLRWRIHVKWGVPLHLQKLICIGRSWDRQAGRVLLSQVLHGTSEGPNQERVIWAIWLSANDYVMVLPTDRHPAYFYKEDYDLKRAICESQGFQFEAITWRAFCALQDPCVNLWCGFNNATHLVLRPHDKRPELERRRLEDRLREPTSSDDDDWPPSE